MSDSINTPEETRVNLLDPSGKLVSVPASQAKIATEQEDFKYPTEQQIQKAQNQEEYGKDVGSTVAAGIFGAARGASAGLSDVLATSEGGLSFGPLGPKTADVLSGLQEANPDVSTAFELGGALVGSLGATPAGAIARGGQAITKGLLPSAEGVAKALVNPESSATVSKILKSATKVGAHALGSGVEGAVYGLGQTLSENALGNADLNAENIMHNVGYGALFGGALGGTLGLTGEAYKGMKGIFSKEIQGAALKDSIIEGAATSPINPLSPPSSIEEVIARNKLGREQGFETDLPAKNRVLETNDILAGDSMFPAHAAQVQSFENPTARLEYKMLLKSDNSVAKDLLQYEAHQKAEGVEKLLPRYIKEISPETKIIDTPIEGGEHATKSFVEKYKAAREAEVPNFEKIDSVGANTINNSDGILYKVFSDLPGAKDLIGFNTSEGGGYFLKPYDATTGVSDQTYKQLRNLTRALNKDNLTIGGLRNLRDVMGDKIDFLKAPKEALQLSNMRRNLMDYMQDEVNKALPDIKVRETMKRYAINEQNRDIMEKIMGGSISDKASFGKGIEPEKVLDRIFSSRENVLAAKNILGDKFNEVTANYMSQLMNKAKDPVKGFSTNSVSKTLINKADILKEAFSAKPEQFNKISAIIDKMRSLPDSPPGNPSDTASATALLKKIHGFRELLQHPTQAIGKAIGSIASKIDEAQQIASLNRKLSGADQNAIAKQQMYSAYSKIERMGQQLGQSIDKHVNAIFKVTENAIPITATKLTPEDKQKKYEKAAKKLGEFTANPEDYLNKISDSTHALNSIAPSITSSLHLASARATQYLLSKLPAQEPASPFTEPYKPSGSEIAVFNRHLEAIENPLIILQQAKEGTLTQESISAVAEVYPKIFTEITNSIMDKLSFTKVTNIPYRTKLMLSMLTGTDMSNSLSSQNMMETQNVIAQSSQPQKPSGAHSAYSKLNSAQSAMTDVQKIENS